MARCTFRGTGEEQFFAAFRRVAETILRVRAHREFVRIGVGSHRIQSFAATGDRVGQRFRQRSFQQSLSLHQFASNGMLEVLDLVAISGPVHGMSP